MVKLATKAAEARDTTGISAKDAAQWFLCDMAEVSGYAITGFARSEMRSLYPQYRPMLTQPDPWYYAGTVALEAAKICDLFPPEESDALLREVFEQINVVIGRKNSDVSTLAFLLLGRLGLGAVLMRRKVPDDMLGKIMMILAGPEAGTGSRMPAPEAHAQLRKALKFGPPVWWAVFQNHFHVELRERPLPREVPLRNATPGII